MELDQGYMLYCHCLDPFKYHVYATCAILADYEITNNFGLIFEHSSSPMNR